MTDNTFPKMYPNPYLRTFFTLAKVPPKNIVADI